MSKYPHISEDKIMQRYNNFVLESGWSSAIEFLKHGKEDIEYLVGYVRHCKNIERELAEAKKFESELEQWRYRVKALEALSGSDAKAVDVIADLHKEIDKWKSRHERASSELSWTRSPDRMGG